jgi:ABC-type transport system involved in multi-copper enzyme maturation permease subunit
MHVIKAIASSTFKEAARDKVFYNLFIFSLIVLVASKILGVLSSGQELKIVMDVGLGCISIFGLVIAVFIGTNLIYKEIERGTIQTIIVKPVYRHEYIIGKYVGLLLIILLNIMLMTVGFYLILRTITDTWNFALLQGILLIFIELMVITSIAVMFSTFSSPILGIILTFCCYAMGHLSEDFIFITDKIELRYLKMLCKTIYNILPHMADFNIKNELVHGITVSNDYIVSATAYGFMYSIGIIFISIIIFSNRNFK